MQQRGKVYVYVRDRATGNVAQGDGGGAIATTLLAPNGVAGDNFGFSVAINARGDMIVVGAPRESSSGNADDAGGTSSTTHAVAGDTATTPTVATQGGGGGGDSETTTAEATTAEAATTIPDTTESVTRMVTDSEGMAAKTTEGSTAPPAVSTTATPGTAGAPLLTASGAAYVYARDSKGVWSIAAVLKSPSVGAFDYFGYSVSIAPLLTNYEQETKYLVAVGANGEDSKRTCSVCPIKAAAAAADLDMYNDNLEGSGAAYLFESSTFSSVEDPKDFHASSGVQLSWTATTTFKAPDAKKWDTFGWSVALVGGAQHATLVVSANGEDSSTESVAKAFGGGRSRRRQQQQQRCRQRRRRSRS